MRYKITNKLVGKVLVGAIVLEFVYIIIIVTCEIKLILNFHENL